MEEVTGTFSKQDAMAAGLWGRNAWKTYPNRMLQVRARSFAIRDAFPDALMGLAVAEEMEDVVASKTIDSKDRMRSLTAQIKGEPVEDSTPADMPPDIVDGEVVPAWKSAIYLKISECKTSSDLKALGGAITKLRGKHEPEDLVDVRGAWKARKDEIEAALQEQVDEGYYIEQEPEADPA